MKRNCVLLVGGALLAAVTVCFGQAPSPPAAQPKPAPTTVEYPEIILSGRTVSAPAKEKSIEELLARLDAIKAQQEELEKARTEAVEQLKTKLRQQKEHIQKLSISIGDDGEPRSAASSSERTAIPDKGGKPKDRVAAFWDPRLRWGTPTDGSNRHIPGIRGRLYVISEAESDLGFQDGASVVVDLYRGENRLETWEIGAPLLKQARRKDGFGSGYDLTLPWTSFSPEGGQVRLKVRYKGPEGTVLEHLSYLTLSGTTRPD
jgi:hypothetical protein